MFFALVLRSRSLVFCALALGACTGAVGERGEAPTRFSSDDGSHWSNLASVLRLNNESVVGVTASGAFVATTQIWNGGYENQRFYGSEQGGPWETLPSSAFEAGHPISHFAAGRVPVNTYCP